MDQPHSKSVKRLLNEWNAECYERDLRRALEQLDESFGAWRARTLGSGELAERIHQFHNGPARELWKQYTSDLEHMNVAHAVAVGLVQEDELPEELREVIQRPLAFYRALKDRATAPDEAAAD